MENEQTRLLEDVVLEMMEFNQNIVKVDSRISMSNDYLNNIDANSFVMNDQLQYIAEILTGNNLAALEKAKEDGVLQERTLNALDQIANNTTPEKKSANNLEIGLGGLGLLAPFAFLSGFIVGFVKSQVKILAMFGKAFLKGISLFATGISAIFAGAIKFLRRSKLINSIFNLFDNIAGIFKVSFEIVKDILKRNPITNAISAGWSSLKKSFITQIDGWKKEFKLFKDFFSSIGKSIGSATAKFLNLGKDGARVADVFSDLGKFFSGWVSKITGVFKGVGSNPLLTKIFSFGKVFGKLLGPIITIWNTITGAFKGFQEDGIIGGLLGAVKGFFLSFGEIGNMIKDVVSWISEKLGFTDFAAMLDGFDFVALINNTIDGVVDWVKTLFTDPTAALSELWNNLVGEGGLMDLIFKPFDMLIDWVTKKFGFRDEDAPEFSIGNIIRGMWNSIIEWFARQTDDKLGFGGDTIRGLKAESATIDIKKMATPPPATATSGEVLNNSNAEKKNADTVTEVARDSASAASNAQPKVMGGGGSSSMTTNANTYNISHGNLPDRTSMSVLSGSFGLSP